MTAALAELLAELDYSPAGTDWLTLEQVLLRAGYRPVELEPPFRRYNPPGGGVPIFLRTDHQYVNVELVRYVVQAVRLRLPPSEQSR